MPILAVAGFHRSGTSMLAGILHHGGVSMGQDMLGADPSNPHGHFEDFPVIEINERILARQGGAWYNDHAVTSLIDPQSVRQIAGYATGRMRTEKTFGFKDPRLLTTIRTWNTVLPDMRIVYIHRGFERSCHSLWLRAFNNLMREEGVPMNAAIVSQKESVIRLYLNNVMSFMNFVTQSGGNMERSVFIDYDALLRGEVDLVSALSRIGVEAPDLVPEDHIDPDAITSSGGFRERLDRALWDEATALDQAIRELCVAA